MQNNNAAALSLVRDMFLLDRFDNLALAVCQQANYQMIKCLDEIFHRQIVDRSQYLPNEI